MKTFVRCITFKQQIYKWNEHLDPIKSGSLRTSLSDGWGLTHDGTDLIASDGSSTLYWLDRDTLETKRKVEVRDMGRAVAWINELEWVEGEVWANVYQTGEDGGIDAWGSLVFFIV
jgi:glutaminyl-peptide cyclotransferase